MDGDDLVIHVAESTSAVVVSPVGALTRASAVRLDVLLRKHLFDRGRVVVDLSECRLLWPSAAVVFPTALAPTGGWPHARLVLSGPDPHMAAALSAARIPLRVPVVPSLAAADVALDVRPARVRRTSDLIPTDRIGQHARSLVNAACEDWDITELRETGLAVVTELVTNAFVHGAADFSLSLTIDEAGLLIGVQDEGRGAPAIVENGNGLRLVDHFSAAWGVSQHATDKVVWARLGVERAR